MFWTGIYQWEIIGPFRVDQGVKINSENYCKFRKQLFEPWLRQKPPIERRRLVYTQDKAPSHASRQAMSYLTSIGFFRIQINGPVSVFPGSESDRKYVIYHEMQRFCRMQAVFVPRPPCMLELPQNLSKN